MDNSIPPNPSNISKPPSRITYRVSILFDGKKKGLVDCMFIKAFNEEDANKYVLGMLEQKGFKPGTYRLETKKSSKSELDFFQQNLKTLSYNGLLN